MHMDKLVHIRCDDDSLGTGRIMFFILFILFFYLFPKFFVEEISLKRAGSSCYSLKKNRGFTGFLLMAYDVILSSRGE
jgi:hypothetical protein